MTHPHAPDRRYPRLKLILLVVLAILATPFLLMRTFGEQERGR